MASEENPREANPEPQIPDRERGGTAPKQGGFETFVERVPETTTNYPHIFSAAPESVIPKPGSQRLIAGVVGAVVLLGLGLWWFSTSPQAPLPPSATTSRQAPQAKVAAIPVPAPVPPKRPTNKDQAYLELTYSDDHASLSKFGEPTGGTSISSVSISCGHDGDTYNTQFFPYPERGYTIVLMAFSKGLVISGRYHYIGTMDNNGLVLHHVATVAHPLGDTLCDMNEAAGQITRAPLPPQPPQPSPLPPPSPTQLTGNRPSVPLANLAGTRWRGTVGSFPAELEMVDLTSARLTYSGVIEQLAVYPNNGGAILLKGTQYQWLTGQGQFNLDTFVGSFSADLNAMGGTYIDTANGRGNWQLSRVSGTTQSDTARQGIAVQPAVAEIKFVCHAAQGDECAFSVVPADGNGVTNFVLGSNEERGLNVAFAGGTYCVVASRPRPQIINWPPLCVNALDGKPGKIVGNLRIGVTYD